MTIPPPHSSALPTIKPPQSSGLMPAVGTPRNTITTQPMGMPPRPAAPVPAEGQKNRSTQRLVVTTNAAGKMTSTRPLNPVGAASANLINLPAGMILRCLPPELLAAPLADFEATGVAATEVGLPMNTILSQLPSGKVELTVRDAIARFPEGFVRPREEIAAQLDTMISLPLMDVVMRIPPDLLAVRPDQKDVDASVRRMADPFTEDELARAAAASAVPPSEPDAAVEETPPPDEPAPEESYVSQDAPPVPPPIAATRSFIPAARNPSVPLLHQTATLSGRPAVRPAASLPGRITPSTAQVPMPPGPKQLSASQILGVPRPTVGSPLVTPHIAGATASGPIESGPGTGITEPANVPQIPPVTATTVMPSSARPQPAPSESQPPNVNADELQRLAALAMAQIGDGPVEETPAAAEEEPAPETTAPAAEESSAPAVPPPAEKVEPAFAATSRFQVPSQPVRELAQTAQMMPPTQPEPIRLPTSSEPNRPPGVSESIRPPGVGTGMAPSRATTRMTPPPFSTAPTSAPEPAPAPAPVSREPEPESAATAASAINLNNCSADDLMAIPGMTRTLAANIVHHRDKLGEFHKLEELLDVPGMTNTTYSSLTGETPSSGVHPSINELLGFAPERELSLKDVTERICCWPDVTGCLLSQKNGLHLVGTAPDFLDKEAIVAFAPRMFEDVNKSFNEITGRESDELIIPTTGTSFHLLREKDLYMIILSRLPMMPERHLKIARFVLAGLSTRPN